MRKLDYKYYTDDELLSLIKADDHSAYESIFEKYSAVLYIHACKRLENREECKDIVQTVFVNLWNKRMEIEITSNLFNYLYTSVRNGCLNYISKERTRDNFVSAIQEFSLKYESSGYDRVMYQNYYSIILQEIESLPPRTKEIFKLSRFEMLTNREIAESLNLSEQTVKSTIKNALRALRRKFSNDHVFFKLFL